MSAGNRITYHWLSLFAGLVLVFTLVLQTAPVAAQSGEITGRVYHDLNLNRVYDAGVDLPLEGVTVTLLQAGQTVATDVSEDDGTFEFDELAAGNYVVRESDPVLFKSTTPNLVPVQLGTGGSAVVSFGDIKDRTLTLPLHGWVSGVVFDDRNGNRVPDPGEPGLAGVPVSIIDESGNEITVRITECSRTTDAHGLFSCDPVPQGTYQIRVTVGTDVWIRTIVVGEGEVVTPAISGTRLAYLPAVQGRVIAARE